LEITIKILIGFVVGTLIGMSGLGMGFIGVSSATT
jgi:hypothetical protein